MHSCTLPQAIARLSLGLGLALGIPVTQAETCDIATATLVESTAKTAEASTQDVRRIIVEGTAILVDTRTSAEYAAGHIPGARLLADRSVDPVEAVMQIIGGDKNKALVLYCNITPSWEIPVLDQSKAPNRDWLPNTTYCRPAFTLRP